MRDPDPDSLGCDSCACLSSAFSAHRLRLAVVWRGSEAGIRLAHRARSQGAPQPRRVGVREATGTDVHVGLVVCVGLGVADRVADGIIVGDALGTSVGGSGGRGVDVKVGVDVLVDVGVGLGMRAAKGRKTWCGCETADSTTGMPINMNATSTALTVLISPFSCAGSHPARTNGLSQEAPHANTEERLAPLTPELCRGLGISVFGCVGSSQSARLYHALSCTAKERTPAGQPGSSPLGIERASRRQGTRLSHRASRQSRRRRGARSGRPPRQARPFGGEGLCCQGVGANLDKRDVRVDLTNPHFSL